MPETLSRLNRSYYSIFTQAVMLSGCVFIVLMSIYGYFSHLSFKNLLNILINKWYYLDSNIAYCFSPFLNYIYLATLLAVSLILIFFHCKTIPFVQIFHLACLVAFTLSLGLQTIHHVIKFKKEIDFVKETPKMERPALYSKTNYPFSVYVKNYLQKPQSCDFVSDIDFTDKRYMGNMATLRYYLYPVDIYFDRTQPKDCLIVSWAEDPLSHVPSDYKALPIFQEKHVLAIKDHHEF